MKLNDAVLGAVFLALALLVLWTIQGYPKIPGQNVGPAAFPGVAATILAGQGRRRDDWCERRRAQRGADGEREDGGQ